MSCLQPPRSKCWAVTESTNLCVVAAPIHTGCVRCNNDRDTGWPPSFPKNRIGSVGIVIVLETRVRFLVSTPTVQIVGGNRFSEQMLIYFVLFCQDPACAHIQFLSPHNWLSGSATSAAVPTIGGLCHPPPTWKVYLWPSERGEY